MAAIIPIRPAASALGNGIKTPYTFPSCFASAPYTTASRPITRAQSQAKKPTTILLRTASSPRQCFPRTLSPQSTTRAASTSTSPRTPPSARPAAPTPPPSDPSETLTWNRFLALRKTRRALGLVASVVSAAGSTVAGTFVLASQDMDAIGAATLGLDPLIVMGLGAVAFGGVGWLFGPTLGNGVFALVYRRLGRGIADKEREFYARIKKYRVDPTSSSLSNPVPDYYGEKIGSVADYRRWLKDQRAFNLKISGKPRVGRLL